MKMLSQQKPKRASDKDFSTKTLIIFCALMLVISAIFGVLSYRKVVSGIEGGVSSALNSFDEEKEEVKQQKYEEIKQKAYDKAEAQYHTSNRATIEVKQLQRLTALEVLQVNGADYWILNKGDKGNDYGVTCWQKVPWSGTFTVDMRQAEYLVDEARQEIVIRIPKPKLTTFDVTDADKGNTYLHVGDENVSSKYIAYKEKQLADFTKKLEQETAKDQEFNLSAEGAAIKEITAIVKAWNPNIPELSVVVECT